MNPVHRINSWYDNLQEPLGFLLFMVGVMVPIATLLEFYPLWGVLWGGIFVVVRLIGYPKE